MIKRLAPFYKHILLLVLLGIALFYFVRLPFTVQMGDTGELVSAAFNYWVPHPPGYPLFIWLQGLFIHIFEVGTVFWRASFLNLIFSVGTLFFLGSAMKEEKLLSFGLVLILASSRIFWKFSLLPDVFALNSLFASVILFLYVRYGKESSWSLLVPFVFLLGLTNHLTLIFLSPVVADIIFAKRSNRVLWASIFAGLSAFILLYSSLVLLHPDGFNSWGTVLDIRNIVRHLLRSDYGTFKLVGSSDSASDPFSLWKIFIKENLIALWPLLGMLFYIFLKKVSLNSGDRKTFLLLVFSLLLYPLVFFALTNTNIVGFLTETIERFFIFFQILLAFTFVFILNHSGHKISQKLKYAFGIGFISFALFQFYINAEINDFSKNTIIEDYGLTLLNEAPLSKPTILLTSTDARVFSLRYIQYVLGVRQDVKVIPPRSLFYPWYPAKVIQETGLHIDVDRILSTQNLSIDDLVIKNLERFSFLSTFDNNDSNSYHIEILPLGKLITSGKGVSVSLQSFSTSGLRSSGLSIPTASDKYDVFREIWSEYCRYPLTLSQYYWQGGSKTAAIATLQKSITDIPWCTSVRLSLCQFENQDNSKLMTCEKEAQNISGHFYNYYNLQQ